MDRKVVLVTGSSRGIGKAAIIEFAKNNGSNYVGILDDNPYCIMDFYDIVKDYQEDNEKLKILGLLIIKYKGRQNLTKDLEDNILQNYAKKMHTKVFDTKIRESVKCQEAQTMRVSLLDYAPKSTVALDYINLVDEILNDLF